MSDIDWGLAARLALFEEVLASMMGEASAQYRQGGEGLKHVRRRTLEALMNRPLPMKLSAEEDIERRAHVTTAVEAFFDYAEKVRKKKGGI